MIRRALDELGMTQEQLAKAVGVTRPTVHVWLNAQRPQPRTEVRERIAELLGVDRALVDEAVYIGLGFKLAPVPARVQLLARMAAQLDEYDVDDLERQIFASLSKYRRGRPRPGSAPPATDS